MLSESALHRPLKPSGVKPRIRPYAAIGVSAVMGIVTYFVLLAQSDVQGLLTNSDLLLAVDLMNDVLHHARHAIFFQIPRVPSLFPDLTFYFILQVLFPSWKLSLIIYGCVMLFLMNAICARICWQISRVSFSNALLNVSSCTVIALLLGTQIDGQANALLDILLPLYHGGPFLVALAALVLARHCLAHTSSKADLGLVVLAALGTLSDRLFIGTFLLPLLGFVVLCSVFRWDHDLASHSLSARRADPHRARHRIRIVGLAIVGCAIGYGIDLALFGHWLLREPDAEIALSHQIRKLGRMVSDGNIQFEVAASAVIMLAPLTWKRRSLDDAYWWTVASISAMGCLLITSLLWENRFATRFCQPIWWWAPLIACATLSRWNLRLTTPGLVSVTGALLVTCLLVTRNGFAADPLAGEDAPLAACLMRMQKDGIIRDGLADYWVARPLEIESNWALSIRQITPYGTAEIWGNNTWYYLHSRAFPAQATQFNFIVMKNLDQQNVVRRLGSPDQVEQCPGSQVWVYRDRSRLLLNLRGAATAADRYGMLSEQACLGPGQFTNQVGPIPPSGIDMPNGTEGLTVASWGPYIGLHRGSWDLTLTYRLSRPTTQPAAWDVTANVGRQTLAQGALPVTGGKRATQAITLHLDADTPGIEFRTFLAGGDHLEIVHLRLARPDATPDACDAGTLSQNP